jgi:hypothetical protein
MPLVREHYLRHIESEFPELHERYQRAYVGLNAPQEYVKGLEERANKIRVAYGYLDDSSMRYESARGPAQPSPAATGPQQLAIPLLTRAAS